MKVFHLFHRRQQAFSVAVPSYFLHGSTTEAEPGEELCQKVGRLTLPVRPVRPQITTVFSHFQRWCIAETAPIPTSTTSHISPDQFSPHSLTGYQQLQFIALFREVLRVGLFPHSEDRGNTFTVSSVTELQNRAIRDSCRPQCQKDAETVKVVLNTQSIKSILKCKQSPSEAQASSLQEKGEKRKKRWWWKVIDQLRIGCAGKERKDFQPYQCWSKVCTR